MGVHDTLRAQFLTQATASGGPIVFPDAGGTPAVQDPTTGVWTGGTAPSPETGYAVQTDGDPDRFAALGLVLNNPVTVLVAAQDLSVVPSPGMRFQWASKPYTTKLSEPHGPDGDPIYYKVTGDS
jgi:hypothetical protein